MSTGSVLAQMRRPSDSWVGTVSSADPLEVRFDSADVPCVQVGSWTPVVGYLVRVQERGGIAYCDGYVWPWPRPQTVTVTSETATTVDANGDPVLLPGHLTAEDGKARVYKLRYLPGYTPAVNDEVRVDWGTPAGLVIALVAAQQPAPVPPGSGAGSTSGVSTFPAIDGGTYRGSGWRTDTTNIAQGSYGSYGNNWGAWFYGGAIQSMLAGSTATGARIRLLRNRGGALYGAPGQQVHLYHHTSPSRPSTNVARDIGPQTIRMPLDGQATWFPLDLTIAQALIDSGGGVAIADPSGNAYVNLAGPREFGESGLIEISYTRT